MTTSAPLSPMMMQWHACKQEAGDALLLFRLGDFFEAFYEDAELLAKELDLTLTKRHTIPMSGIPVHTGESYIDRLVAKGYRVAVAEQVEDSRAAKGLVKREIVRIVTPGTVINSSLLSDKSNNFLVCITQLNHTFGLAILDLTTAEFRALQLDTLNELLNELATLSPSEILLSEKCAKIILEKNYHYHVKPDWFFDHKIALERLLKHFKVHSLEGFGLKGWNAAINAAGSLLSYVSDDLSLSISHLQHLSTQRLSHYMSIDATTARHLEFPSLLHHLDQTLTPMGARLLKQWLTHPLLCPTEIKKRQEAVALFIADFDLSSTLRGYFKKIKDLERLIMRIETGHASPRDLIALSLSLEQIEPISSLLQVISTPLIKEEVEQLSSVSELVDTLQTALVESPPLRLSDGGIFKKGYDAGLDELHTLKEDNHTWIAHYQTRLRELTLIKTLKVSYTHAFGFYIEVSRGQASKMPDYFQKKQTLVNTERFTTPELQEYEHKVVTSEERIKALESELFLTLRNKVILEAKPIRDIAKIIALLDCLLGLAYLADKYHYIAPSVDESSELVIKEGRHPVIEAMRHQEPFIPNDVTLNSEERLILITGPNMAGKSTYIRQVALIVIMAQIGSYVPATSAHIGIIDRVFSRIGASDDLSKGQSTFMVEMTETANILNNITDRSLVILDEIGRGTSTYDGISIAWAVAEFLLTQKAQHSKTLFATHYWELTQMEGKISGAVNAHVAVHESNNKVVFLHKIMKGSSDRSYGIYVARLAGLPNWVIQRAEQRLSSLEKDQKKVRKQEQLDFFDSHTLLSPSPTLHSSMIEELKSIDPNHLTPIEALQKIMSWKKYEMG